MPADDRRFVLFLGRLWRLPLVLIVLSLYFALSPFGYLAFWLLHLCPNPKPQRRALGLQKIVRTAFRWMHDTVRILGILDYEPRPGANLLPDTPCVVIANHTTLLDTSVLLSTFPRVVTMVKPRLYRRWWIRPLLRDAGHIEGLSPGALNADRAIRDGIDRLQKGFHLLAFPEGTRAPDDKLLPFGRTAFEIACQANVPIIPIIIDCRPRWLTKERGFFPLPRQVPRIRIKVLDRVAPESVGNHSRALRDVIHALMEKEVTSCRTPR